MELDFSKEAILGRMLSSIVDLWGVKQNENLDPVVRLMMEAFATEIFKVQQNIHVSNARLVEHLAEVLTPTKLTAAVPAHAIMHAGCAPTTQVIEDDMPYEVVGESIKGQKFLFTPIDYVKLYNAEVTDIITPSNVCKMDNCIYKNVITVPNSGSVPQDHVWVGINVSNQLREIKGLSFFIDWPNLGSKNELHRSMRAAKWTVSGEIPLQMIEGLFYPVSDYKSEDSPVKVDTFKLVVDDIKNSYQSQFFTINNDIPKLQENIQKYPSVFENYFSKEQLSQFFTQGKLWIRIELPVYLEEDVLNDMLINTNCFPVINRNLKVATGNTSVISLICDSTERILSIGAVYGAVNGPYNPLELKETHKSNTYALKKGGVERFDKRDAYELVKDLELLLKNEVQAFVSINKGNDQDLIDSLDAVVDHTRNFSRSEENKALQYVMLEKEIPNEVVTVEFWVSKGEEANKIRMGAIPKNVRDSSQVGCILLTYTAGGKDSQSETERIRAYQYALLTKEQIVSAQDIKSFIYYQLGERALQVDVKSGLVIGQGSKQGLMRSIDIYINTVDTLKKDVAEQQILGDVLLKKLHQQSDPSRTYRLFWNEVYKN